MAPSSKPNGDVIQNGSRIVISGISGVYPDSRHVQDFSEILYNKVNPVKHRSPRWNFKHPDLMEYVGNVPDLDRFDSQFFKLSHRVGNTMDTMSRKLMEQTYQAIYDAGLSPDHLAGRAIGVFIGSCFSDTEKVSFYGDVKAGAGLVGCSKTMFANRISYWLDIKGPSISFDESCCSTIGGLEAAYRSILRGECEAAIVGAGHLVLHPQTLIHLSRLMKLSPDGKTRSFDINAEGCSQSEAISVFFIQKATDALRIYAEIVHVKCEFSPVLAEGMAQKSVFYRNPSHYAEFLKQFYIEAKVAPHEIEYVEAFGIASLDVDKSELEVIDNVFCANKTETLKVGSVMSNIGYTEAASGGVAITKVLLAYQKGEVAANLNCENPRQDVPAIRQRRVCIVSENQPITRSYIAINNLSFNGINGHVLLNGWHKPKNLNQYKSSVPQLVLISGRQDSAVKMVIDNLKSRAIDYEELALLRNIHEKRISGHLGRGYAVLDTSEGNETVCLGEKAEYYDDSVRPLWFVYSGMGSQWNEMGAHLMRMPAFAEAIHKCQKTLQPFGVDVIHIITSSDKSVFLGNNIASMVGIVAIQIALTDVLTKLGMVPDKMIGHSLGEIGCGYADGCLTLEEAILAAYYRGLVSAMVPVIPGAMAAVGLGAKQIQAMCPADIVVACHNGPDTCTLSGPDESMSAFVSELTTGGIFAKMVESGNIAYHSKYIAEMDKPHLEYLKQIIKMPRLRSDRWVCTSVPVERWNEPDAKYLSAEYLNNNMMTPVLFEEGLKFVPSNAVLVEIAPHGLLQAILKRSLSSDCRHIPLTKRKDEDNIVFLLNAIGRIYIEGYNPKVANLYPKVQFPVSTETPLLSHLVQWGHEEKLDLPLYVSGEKAASPSTKQLITLHDDEYQYLRGNVIRGKIVYPFAAALIATWDTFALNLGLKRKEVSVQLRDVHLFAQPILHEQRQLNITVIIHRGTGRFEVSEDITKIATGFITKSKQTDITTEPISLNNEDLILRCEDIYEMFSERGLSYGAEFRSIHKANIALNEGLIVWNDWVTLLDGMLQLNAMKHSYLACQPTYIRQICIDVDNQYDKIYIDEKAAMPIRINEVQDSTRCGGILINNIKFHNLPALSYESLFLETSKSVSYGQLKNNEDLWDGKFTHLKEDEKVDHVVTLNSRVGDLESLQWVEAPAPNESGILVKVDYAGFNDCDIKRATGVIPLKNGRIRYGMDFSGNTESGDHVMGVVSEGSVSSSVVARPELLWKVPKDWSLEDAATVPLAYCLAFYCLSIKTEMSKGMKVLILGGAGALGQAAISIALAHGCTVFTTVSDNNKKQLLLKLFPKIKESHIASSRDHSFGENILKATDGEGCDIVLSCVSGGLRNISLSCCAFCGVTLDTVQIHSKEKFALDLHHLTWQRSYMPVDFSTIFTHNHVEDMKKLYELVQNGIARGYVRPLTRVSYSPDDIITAFKLLQSSRRSGRVLIRMSDPISLAKSRLTCSPKSVHVVICENQGLQLVDKLISRGARKVRLHCLNPPGYLTLKNREWQKQGIDIEITFGDLDTDNTKAVFNNCKGHIEGIYIVANECSDMVEKLVRYVDMVSRKMCPFIKNFIIITPTKIGTDVYRLRAEEKLPVTIVYLPQVRTCNENRSSTMTWTDAMEAVERAVNSSQSLVRAFFRDDMQPSLLTQLCSIAGFKLSNTVPDTATLQSLELEANKIQAIGALLRDAYNLHYEEDQIKMLTLEKIKELDEKLSWSGFKRVEGLNTFFSNIDPDEVLASTPIVYMKTRTNTTKSDEFDTEQTYLTIIPGVEGHHDRFRPLCEQLKLPALVLQPGFSTAHQTHQELAQRYVQILMERLKLNKSFYILGYENGVPIALEVAAILEKKGLTGTVFCIGVHPDDLPLKIKTSLNISDAEDKHLENIIALHISNLFIKDEDVIAQLEKEIYEAETWEDKIEIYKEQILNNSGHSAQYITEVLNSALQGIKQAINLKFTPQNLNSKVVFLLSDASSKVLDLSKQPVAAYTLMTPLNYMLLDLRCASIVNKHLGPEILELFERNNLCETYIHRGNTFAFVQCPE